MITKLNGHSPGSPQRQWIEATFPHEPRSVRDARHFVGSLVAGSTQRDEIELMVSELATNALLYAPGEFEVRVSTSPRLRVELRDANPLLPSIAPTSPEATSGRGLRIVSQLAASWGAEPFEQGKAVWFEL